MKAMRRLSLACGMYVLSTACAAVSHESAMLTGGDDSEAAVAETDVVALRLDVHPPDFSDEFPVRLLTQTFEVATGTTEQSVVLRPPVVVEGSVTAFIASPSVPNGPPGSQEPVVHATISLTGSNGITRSTATDDTGVYRLEVVPDGAYTLTISSSDPLVPPYREVLGISTDMQYDLDLSYGNSIYGQVVEAEGSPVVGASVYAIDDQGLTSGTALTDEDGFYLLQVSDGDWSVVSEGRADGRDPVITLDPVSVDEWGAELDVIYADLEQVSVGGRVVNEDGDGISGVTVRLEAIEVDGYEPGTTLVVEAQSNDSGNYDTKLVRGEYLVTLIPDDEDAISGTQDGPFIIDEDANLGTTTLPAFVSILGTVIDPSGAPLPGAAVSLQELDFAGRGWSVYTDDDGRFEAIVAQGQMTFAVSPPTTRPDLALSRMVRDTSGDAAPELQVLSGSRLQGQVLYENAGAIGPIPYAWLEVVDNAGNLWAGAVSDDAGRFEAQVAGL